MLQIVHELIMQRARANSYTILQKVKSHIGIFGNGKADVRARDSTENPTQCQFTLHVNNQYLSIHSTGLALPCT